MNGIYSQETNCGFFSERMSFFRRMVVESILLSRSSNFPRENYLTEIIWAFPPGSKDPGNVGAKDPRNVGRRILGMWDMCFYPLCVNDRSERINMASPLDPIFPGRGRGRGRSWACRAELSF